MHSLMAMARTAPPTPSTATAKLAKYQSMRDFGVTAEPSGASTKPAKAAKSSRVKSPRASASAPARSAAGRAYVIQKHAASRLHYDFRLELEGVLLSWSVPKGPSLKPAERRLAVRTEDHPLGYKSFEGIIPKGQYGGGTVLVWDQGSWDPIDDPTAGLAKGHLQFELHGEKLTGRWHLVKTRGDGKQETWILFKGKDASANEVLDIVATRPESVISGRTVEQVAAAREGAPPAAGAARTQAELAALVAKLPLGFPVTSLDKQLWAEGTTKGELLAYFAVVADWMLPHVANRPLTLVRCPEGAAKPCFFQKHLGKGYPPPIERLPIREASGDQEEYMVIRDMPGLVACAQMGSLELHTWGARADKPERPDLMVFDLDPDVGMAWDQIALAAFAMRRKLHDLGLTSFVKTTGGEGLHIVVPVKRTLEWDDFKRFSQRVCEQMETEEPTLYTTTVSKAARKGKIFLDYLRNGRGATFVSPYSPRRRPGAPVAVPITWEELAAGVDPAAFTIASVPPRLAQLAKDPWEGMLEITQSITAATWKAVGGKS